MAAKQNSAKKKPIKKSTALKSNAAKIKSGLAPKETSRLGRGLSALFSENGFSENSQTPETVKSNAKASSIKVADGESLVQLSLSEIKAGSLQARKYFNPEKITELANSMQRHGVIEPLLVRSAISGGYEIIAGERRYRAAKKLGLKTIPAIIRQESTQLSHEVMLVENLQREDLTASEEAQGLAKIMKESNLTQAELAEKLGKSRSYVANALRLLKLPPYILTKIEIGELSPGVARALVGLEEKQLKTIISRIENQNLNAREVERLVATTKQSLTSPEKPANKLRSKSKDTVENHALRDADLLLMEDQLREAFKSKVKLKDIRAGVGKLEVEYYSYSDLDDLIKKLQ